MLYDKRWEHTETHAQLLEPWQKVLLDAADLIERGGHVQGSFARGRAFCVMGAVIVARHGYLALGRDDLDEFTACQMFRRHINDFGIAEWNDVPGRTKAEVVGALRGAAKQKA